MCKFMSLVLTKNAEHWLEKSDSHEDIIARCGLHPDGVRGPNIIRVELTPPDGFDWTDLSKWTYIVDQDRLPEWADRAADEDRARAVLAKRAQGWQWLPAIAEARKFAFENATRTDPAQRITAMSAAKRFYELGGFRGEPQIHWCKTLQERASLRDSLWDSLRASLRASLWDSLWDSLRASLWASQVVALHRIAIATPGATLPERERTLLDLHSEIVTSSYAPWMCDGHIVLCERPSHIEIKNGRVVDMKWER